MTLPSGWTFVSFATLEAQGSKMVKRYAMSLPLDRVPVFAASGCETIQRDGLGEWNVVAVKSDDYGVFLFGSPMEDGAKSGADIWVSKDLPDSKVANLVRHIIADDSISIMPA